MYGGRVSLARSEWVKRARDGAITAGGSIETLGEKVACWRTLKEVVDGLRIFVEERAEVGGVAPKRRAHLVREPLHALRPQILRLLVARLHLHRQDPLLRTRG
jgi:hypothetical protein